MTGSVMLLILVSMSQITGICCMEIYQKSKVTLTGTEEYRSVALQESPSLLSLEDLGLQLLIKIFNLWSRSCIDPMLQ